VDPQPTELSTNMSTITLKRNIQTERGTGKRLRYDQDAPPEEIVIPRFFTEAQMKREVEQRVATEKARLAAEHETRVKALQSDYLQRVQAMNDELAEITRQWTEKPRGDYIS